MIGAARASLALVAMVALVGAAGCAVQRTSDVDAQAAASASKGTGATGASSHITGSGDKGDGDGDGDGDSAKSIPSPVGGAPPVPAPDEPNSRERYTVVVNEVPAQELLFSLARDADLEIDIIGDFDSKVTLNAVDETLPRLLERIALQAPIRYELTDGYLKIAKDAPYLETYAIPYVDMTRTGKSKVTTATQVGRTGSRGTGGDGSGSVGQGGGNNSRTSVTNRTDNQFWQTLERNLASILGVASDKGGGEGSNGDSNRVIVNREAGYVSVRATQDQHKQIQAYIDRVVASARRQVLIEATVVEVRLDDRHQSGVNWSVLAQQASGLDIVQNVTGSALGGGFNVPSPGAPGPPAATIGYTDPDTSDGSLQSTIKLLDRFGEVSVVSSPKITALNNQIAILKVVDNRVYFELEVTETEDEDTGETTREVDSEARTVPVGLVMSVTPYIGSGQQVLLNVRPTVSRILGFQNDPNPQLAAAGVQNPVPEIQVREMESLLRVNSGQVAVIGGLMTDKLDKTKRSVPVLGDLPLVGGLFSYRDESVKKTELIVFLRPKIVDNASLEGDYSRFRSHLPEPGGPGGPSVPEADAGASEAKP